MSVGGCWTLFPSEPCRGPGQDTHLQGYMQQSKGFSECNCAAAQPKGRWIPIFQHVLPHCRSSQSLLHASSASAASSLRATAVADLYSLATLHLEELRMPTCQVRLGCTARGAQGFPEQKAGQVFVALPAPSTQGRDPDLEASKLLTGLASNPSHGSWVPGHPAGDGIIVRMILPGPEETSRGIFWRPCKGNGATAP